MGCEHQKPGHNKLKTEEILKKAEPRSIFQFFAISVLIFQAFPAISAAPKDIALVVNTSYIHPQSLTDYINSLKLFGKSLDPSADKIALYHTGQEPWKIQSLVAPSQFSPEKLFSGKTRGLDAALLASGASEFSSASSDSSRTRGLIFLTRWVHTRRLIDLLPYLSRMNVAVAINHRQDKGVAKLREVLAQTGVLLYEYKGPADITANLQMISNEMEAPVLLTLQTIDLMLNQQRKIPVDIPEGAQAVLLTVQGLMGNPDVRLYTPSGPATLDGRKIQKIAGLTNIQFKLANPAPGRWTIELRSPGSFLVRARRDGEATWLTLPASETMSPILLPIEPTGFAASTGMIILSAQVSDDEPIAEAGALLDGKKIPHEVRLIESTTGSFYTGKVICHVKADELLEGEHRTEISANGGRASWPFWIERPRAETVIITEVHPQDPAGPWAEILALKGPVDVSKWILTDLDDKDTPLGHAGPILLEKGERLIVRWRPPRKDDFPEMAIPKGVKISLLPDEAPSRWGDQICLLSGKSVIDAICWVNPQKPSYDESEAQDLSHLIHIKDWEGEPLLLSESPYSLGRKEGSSDTNSPKDWEIQAMPSRGLPNVATTASAIKIGALVINEVFLGSSGSWVEILAYEKEGPLDISRAILTDMDGAQTPLAEEPITLKAGEYAILRWGSGQTETDEIGDKNSNGMRDIYLAGMPPSGTDDQIVLSFSGKLLDCLIWQNEDGKIAKEEIEDAEALIVQGAWKGTISAEDQSGAVSFRDKTHSIARRSSEDSNSSSDWAYASPTPGKPNSLLQAFKGRVVINEIFLAGEGKNWAELFCLEGPADVSSLSLTDLDGDDPPIASSAITLKTGEFAVVRWARGETEIDGTGDANGNGLRDIFIDQAPPSGTDDQLTLKHGPFVLDGLIWENGDGNMVSSEAEDCALLYKSKNWKVLVSSLNPQGAVSTPRGGLSLSRMKDGLDSNGREDWMETSPTPGASSKPLETFSGKVLISEVYLGGESNSWTELYCLQGPANIHALTLTDLDGMDSPLSSQGLTLKTGEIAIVHFAQSGQTETDAFGDANKNGARDIYISDPPPARTQDQLTLISPDGKVQDAVLFADPTGDPPSSGEVTDHESLVKEGAWILPDGFSFNVPHASYLGALAPVGLIGQSTSRRGSTTDTNKADDWYLTSTPTPGKANPSSPGE